MASKIEMIANALILLGDTGINDLSGNERRKTTANNLYENLVKMELSKARWTFARQEQQLSLLVATPPSGKWSNAYQLPSDLITLIALYPSINYQIYGTQVYCNYSQSLYADYIYAADESEWPFYFAKVIEYALAKDMARAITDSGTLHQEMAMEYENASRMARFTDSQQQPQVPIVSNPFIDVRR